MKKLIVLMLLIIPIILSINTTYALDEVREIDLNEDDTYWTLSGGTTTLDNYYITFEVDLLADYSDYEYFQISVNYDEDLLEDCLIYFDFTEDSRVVHNLYMDIGENYDGTQIFTYDLINTKLEFYNTYDNELGLPYESQAGIYYDYHTINSTSTSVYTLTFRSSYTYGDILPDNYYEDIQSLFNIKATNEINIVKYYSRGNIFSSSYYMGDIPDYFSHIPTSTGYDFLGWKTLDGTLYDFETPIQEEWYNTENEFVLYASFMSFYEPEDTDTTISANVPDGLSNFAGIFNGNNTEGYILMFIAINILIVIFALLLKLKYYIPLIISALFYALWIYFGLLNVAYIIVLGLLYILLLIGNFYTRSTEGV